MFVGASVRSLALLLFTVGPVLADSAPTCPVTPLTDSEVTFEKIQERLGDKATSSAIVLACLPESYKKNFALMRDSNSMQSSNPKEPRVILYGKDGRTMIAFNNDKPGNMEIIQYSGTPPKFSPREIVFSPSGPPSYHGKPESCVGCHGSGDKFRPVWDSYDIWPGAFGSLSANGRDMMPDTECAQYEAFTKSVADAKTPATSPYKALKYQPVERINKQCFFDGQGDGSRASPTAHLNHLLSRLALERAMANLKANPNFKKYRFALLSVAMGCNRLESSPGPGNMTADLFAGKNPATGVPSSQPSYDATKANMAKKMQADLDRRVNDLAASGDYAASCKRPDNSNTITNGLAFQLVRVSECPACASKFAGCVKACVTGGKTPKECNQSCFGTCNADTSCQAKCTQMSAARQGLLFKSPDGAGTYDFDTITSYQYVGQQMGYNLGGAGYSSGTGSSRDDQFAFADGLAGIRTLGALALNDPEFTRGVPFLQGTPPPTAFACYPSAADYMKGEYGDKEPKPHADSSICGTSGVRNVRYNPPQASGVADPYVTFGDRKKCLDGIQERMKNCGMLKAMSDAAIGSPGC
ncbi:MAG: hypothetical protein HY074_19860, partial [Deltaproteobacteria bacterium]|nr:hypothetical protein [Deltaproteobacteria bacterium]